MSTSYSYYTHSKKYEKSLIFLTGTPISLEILCLCNGILLGNKPCGKTCHIICQVVSDTKNL